jgi:hypothetical protein
MAMAASVQGLGTRSAEDMDMEMDFDADMDMDMNMDMGLAASEDGDLDSVRSCVQTCLGRAGNSGLSSWLDSATLAVGSDCLRSVSSAAEDAE